MTVQDQDVAITRIPTGGAHTFLTGTKDEAPTYSIDELRRISMKSLIMETLKRFVLDETNSYLLTIESINEEGEYAPNIKNILLDTDRTTSLEEIAKKMKTNISFSCGGSSGIKYDLEATINNSLDEIFFFTMEEESDWKEAYIAVTDLWTGSHAKNKCLVLDDGKLCWNYTTNLYGDENYRGGTIKTACEWTVDYVHGDSPHILLNTLEEVVLEPDFKNTKIVFSQKPFNTDSEAWNFEAGEKQALYYEYEFLTSYAEPFVSEACLSQKDISAFSENFQKELNLSIKEVEIMKNELSGLIPPDDGLYKIQLADPRGIQKYISWKTNGSSADILQLYFQRDKNASCSTRSLGVVPEELFEMSKKREGFEVGLIR